eukprot:9768744-Lingulodinium_polyedra.AAC.1
MQSIRRPPPWLGAKCAGGAVCKQCRGRASRGAIRQQTGGAQSSQSWRFAKVRTGSIKRPTASCG